jgi:hypothetical protein
MDWGGPAWTETPGQSIAATDADRSGRLRTRDGRAMERVVFGQATSRNLRIASRMISLVVV